jgi:hypothetical protein
MGADRGYFLVLVAGVLVGAAACLSGSAPVGLRRTSLQ